MDGNAELLNYVYQNSKMGEETIRHLGEITHDNEFRKHLYLQRKEYQNINKLASRMLHEHGHDEKDLGALEKAMVYMNIEVKTAVDNSPGHLAEMMMNGSTMGIIEATKNLNKYAGADREVLSLAKKLVRTEEANVEHLKPYLS